MRRWMDHHKSIAENYESDESVSEEEEDCEDHVQGGWSITLGETTEKKGRGQVLSQLEILRDARGLEHLIGPSNTPQKRDKLLCIQDGVDDKRQLTCLADRVSTCTSDEENISDEEVLKENNRFLVRYISSGCGNFQKVNFPVSRIARNDDECAWSAVNREVEELVHVTENARCSSTAAIFSKLSKSGKGVRDKAKPKFSFHLQSHKNVSGDTSMPLLEAYKSIKPVTAEQSMSDLLKKFFKGGKIEQSNIHSVQDDVSVGENYTKDSMAVLLDSFRENNALHQGDTKVISSTKERLRLAVKRNIRSLGDRTLDGDESPDILDTDSSTSSDNKVFNQNPEHIIPESKRKKSMADQFQEAIGVASARDEENSFVLPTHLGTGLFGKLQHVIQNEKERDIKFMKQFQSQACLEGSYFDVKISSRWLEGKLTVCSCTFIRHKEDSQLVDNCQIELKTGRAYTIMFSSRSCGDVELEVGNLIRIYPPWKNVSVVEKNEIVILSTYFSQI